jgi:hypothetical protein
MIKNQVCRQSEFSPKGLPQGIEVSFLVKCIVEDFKTLGMPTSSM